MQQENCFSPDPTVGQVSNSRGDDSSARPAPVLWLRLLIHCGIILAFLTIIDSSYIRLIESGAGCDQWPQCYGQYVINEAATGINVLTTMGQDAPLRVARVAHRLIATIFGAVIVFLCLVAFLRPRLIPQGKAVASLLLLLTLILTLIGPIKPELPSPLLIITNLLGGMGLLALVYRLHLQTRPLPALSSSPDPLHIKLSRIGLLLIALQVLVGALNSANYTAASCQNLFICEATDGQTMGNSGITESLFALPLDENSKVIPQPRMIDLQLIHHTLGIITLAYFVWLTLKLTQARSSLLAVSRMSLALIVIQFLLGLGSVLFGGALLILLMHNFFTAMIILSNIVFQSRLATRNPL